LTAIQRAFFYFALSQAFLLAIRLSASTSSFSSVTALAAPKFHALNPRNCIQMPAKNRQETRIVKTRPSGMGYRVPIRPKTSANTKYSTYAKHKSLLRDSKGIQPLWWGPGQSSTKKIIFLKIKFDEPIRHAYKPPSPTG
jgi:hypothetical protein